MFILEMNEVSISRLLNPKPNILVKIRLTALLSLFLLQVWSGAGIRHVHREDGVWRLKTLRGDILAKYVINCAGLHGDDLDKMADLQPQYE